jgi:hypothetical protein
MSSNYGAESTAIIFGILMITMITAPIWGGVGTHDIPALMLVLVTGLVCPILLGGYAWLRWPAVKKLKQFVPIELRSAWADSLRHTSCSACFRSQPRSCWPGTVDDERREAPGRAQATGRPSCRIAPTRANAGRAEAGLSHRLRRQRLRPNTDLATT